MKTEKTELTEEDLTQGRLFALALLEQFSKMRPPVAVVGLAEALAAAAYMAECGPDAAAMLFRVSWERLVENVRKAGKSELKEMLKEATRDEG